MHAFGQDKVVTLSETLTNGHVLYSIRMHTSTFLGQERVRIIEVLVRIIEVALYYV